MDRCPPRIATRDAAGLDIAAAGVVAVMALALWLEHRVMRAQGKAGSWLVVRVASWVAGPLAALAVVMPARSVSGMEGLAVFYALLLTVAPLIWLGVHLGLGARLKPALTFGEGVALSLSGLVVFVLPALALYQALDPLEQAARHMQDSPRNPGPAVLLAHTVQPVLRFHMPTTNAADAPNYVSLLNVTHGGARHDSCVMPGYRWARGPQDPPVNAVAIRFGLPGSLSRTEAFVRTGP